MGLVIRDGDYDGSVRLSWTSPSVKAIIEMRDLQIESLKMVSTNCAAT